MGYGEPCPRIALWLVIQYAMRWPMRAAPFAYASIGAPGLAIFTLAWIVFASVFTPGDPAPIGYVPLLNPLDLASMLALAAVCAGIWPIAELRWQRPVRYALGITAFIALNASALRAVHFLAGVPWNADALSESLLVQAVLSLLWTATAMGLMVLAHRRMMRGWWAVGAALLAAVVVKLFFVDLVGPRHDRADCFICRSGCADLGDRLSGARSTVGAATREECCMRPLMLKALFVAYACGASLAAAQTLGSADFAVRFPVTTTGDGLHVIELPEAVYRAAQGRDLADLRIFNARDQALPIAFVPAPAPVAPTPIAVDLRMAPLPAETRSARVVAAYVCVASRARSRARGRRDRTATAGHDRRNTFTGWLLDRCAAFEGFEGTTGVVLCVGCGRLRRPSRSSR